MARLNRENTLIENNLYPLAGLHPPDVQKKFVEILTPLKDDILNIEAAVLLHNVRLFALFAGFLIGFLVLSIVVTKSFISPVIYLFILTPLLTLVYTLGGVGLARKFYLSPLPDLPEDNLARIRSLEEIVEWIWFPLLWGWRVAFFVYRTYVCPNAIDTVALIVAALLLGLIAKLVNLLIVLFAIVALFLTAPAILARTPVGEYLKNFVKGWNKRKEAKDK
jgi:hypothetical protein